jgi:ferric-dicitrate binding protein FerR (iron transport regulator)
MDTMCDIIAREALQRGVDELKGPFRDHLRDCPVCRERVRNVQRVEPMMTAMARRTDASLPSRAPDELKSRVYTAALSFLAEEKAGWEKPGKKRASSAQPRRPSLWSPMNWKKLAWSAGALAAIVLAVGIGSRILLESRGIGKVEFAEGSVQLIDGSGSTLSRDRGRLEPGTTIRTGETGRGLFDMGDDVLGVMAGSTSAVVVDRDRLQLDRGEIWFSVIPEGRGFAVDTPHGRVEVTGTEFGVRVGEFDLSVEVIDGDVRVSRGVEQNRVAVGEILKVQQGGGPVVARRSEGSELPDWVLKVIEEVELEYVAKYIPSLKKGK